ncbi:MAG: hypothetical protein Q7R30_23880 [Acidobacteriota bacterium]|nr:hypothetical protein [Acidobacteriota bacterium]
MPRYGQHDLSAKMGGDHIRYDRKTGEVVGYASSPVGLKEMFRYHVNETEYNWVAARMVRSFGKTRSATKALFNFMAAGARA